MNLKHCCNASSDVLSKYYLEEFGDYEPIVFDEVDRDNEYLCERLNRIQDLRIIDCRLAKYIL